MNRQRSAQLYSEAQRVIPGGVNSPARSWGAVGGTPIFFAKGKGSHVWDADGNEYIDYVCSWGPLILGHADDGVVSAVTDAAQVGTSFGAPTEAENQMASLVAQAYPSVSLVRFVSSGTEAAMSALRLARAFTGRDKIIKFQGGYHGHADALLVAAGSGATSHGVPDSAGVTDSFAQDTLIAQFNDIDSVSTHFDEYPDSIACVIVEPVAGNMGVVPPDDGFLEGLRTLTTERGALLIFDEVITGFRVALEGAQGIYGVTPDLTCFGKIVGGGMPVGAYGGREDVMNVVSPLGPMYQAGTLSGNPVAMAAGIETVTRLQAPEAYQQLEENAALLADGLNAVFAEAETPLTINRVGSMMTLFFNPGPVNGWESVSQSDRDGFTRFFHNMLDEGVYLPPSPFEAMFVSLAHTTEDIERTIEAARNALK
ncbi:MAG: glutamate-1-semialdehyde 2,1-aminomutase [SAR202 cluster bacterium]|nr:glutamate-1-semialdehyde 2,1-aminomutase [SAR202 cluster bacterium]MDP6513838.1 glutamate-1-semialdehyde 2,1-aminomutase [SAR202 cluster bacterium]